MRKRRLATYNPATCVWETDDLCMGGHSVPYSATWPSSGMTQGGTAYELPTWAPPTAGSGSSSWRIPVEGLLWTPVTTPERPQKGRDPNKWPASLNQQVTEDLPSSPTYRPDLAATCSRSPDPDDVDEADLLPTHMRNDPSYRSPESQTRRSSSGFTDLVTALDSEGLVPTPRAGITGHLTGRDYHHNLEEWAWDPTTRGNPPEPAEELDEDLLFPTPAVNDMGDGKTVEEWDAWNAGETMRHQMHGQPLSIVAQDLDRSGAPKESLRRRGRTTTPAGTADAPSSSAPTSAATAAPQPSHPSSLPLLPSPDAYSGTRGASGDPAARKAAGHALNLEDVIEKGGEVSTSSPGSAGLLPGTERLAPSAGTTTPARGGTTAPTASLLSTPKASNNENVCSESYSNLATDLKEVDPELRLLGEGTSPRSDGGTGS